MMEFEFEFLTVNFKARKYVNTEIKQKQINDIIENAKMTEKTNLTKELGAVSL